MELANVLAGFTMFGIGLAIMFGIFLAIREIVLWYFRLNQIANNIAYIADHCRRIDGLQPLSRQAPPAQRPLPAPMPPAPVNPFAPQGIQPRRNP